VDIEDRVAFGQEVQRLKNAGLAVPPSVRGAWALLMVGDVFSILGIVFVAIAVGGWVMHHVPLALATPAFAAGMGATFVVGLKARREVLRHAYRALAAGLDMPAPGAVGGVTSAGFPALFSAPLPKPPPPRQQDVVRPVRVGDPDAEDFDD